MAESDLVRKWMAEGVTPEEIESRLRLRRASKGLPALGESSTRLEPKLPLPPEEVAPPPQLLPPAPKSLPEIRNPLNGAALAAPPPPPLPGIPAGKIPPGIAPRPDFSLPPSSSPLADILRGEILPPLQLRPSERAGESPAQMEQRVLAAPPAPPPQGPNFSLYGGALPMGRLSPLSLPPAPLPAKEKAPEPPVEPPPQEVVKPGGGLGVSAAALLGPLIAGQAAADQMPPVFEGPTNDERDARVNRLENLKDLSEALGGFRVLTPGMIASGVAPPAPMLATGIRRKIGEAEDTMTKDEMQTIFETFGVRLGPGSKRSKVLQLMPAVADVLRSRAAGALAVSREEARNTRQNKAMAKLSDKQVQDITALDKGLGLLYQIREEKPTAEAGFDTGPLANAWHTGASWVGLNDPDKAAFKAKIVHQFNDYLHTITGAAVSPGEVARMGREMPTMSDNDEAFTKKLDLVIKNMEDLRGQTIGNLDRQGKNVEAFSGSAPPTSAGAQGKVPMYDPDTGAKVGEVWENEVEEARSRGAVPAKELRKAGAAR